MCSHYVRADTVIYVSSYYYICALILLCVVILLYLWPQTIVCVLILMYVSSYRYMCPHTAIGVLTLLHMCPRACKRPTNACVWHAWVLREVSDVCAGIQFGKLDRKHLSRMLSLVSTDPAWSEEQVLRGGGRDATRNTLQQGLAGATTCCIAMTHCRSATVGERQRRGREEAEVGVTPWQPFLS